MTASKQSSHFNNLARRNTNVRVELLFIAITIDDF